MPSAVRVSGDFETESPLARAEMATGSAFGLGRPVITGRKICHQTRMLLLPLLVA
jgi:hypothetical protein